jgi:hypothetical protein
VVKCSNCDQRGSCGGGICVTIVTAGAAAHKRGYSTSVHKCALLGPLHGQQPLSSNFQLKGYLCLRWLREGMQRHRREAWGIGDKFGEGLAAHWDHMCSPQLCPEQFPSPMATVVTRDCYMPPRLGSTTPSVWTKKFLQKKGGEGATSGNQGPMPNQTAFFRSLTFSVFLL